MEPIRYFTVYSLENTPEKYLHTDSKIWRILDWILGRFGLHICYLHPGSGNKYEEYKVDSIELLELIKEQLEWYRIAEQEPTTIVIGRPQFESLLHKPYLEDYFTYDVPLGVPMMAGLKLVCNPIIDGIVVC